MDILFSLFLLGAFFPPVKRIYKKHYVDTKGKDVLRWLLYAPPALSGLTSSTFNFLVLAVESTLKDPETEISLESARHFIGVITDLLLLVFAIGMVFYVYVLCRLIRSYWISRQKLGNEEKN